MCAACFDAAAWPWKVCADCEPARREAVAKQAAEAGPRPEPLVCPWCGQEAVGLATGRPPCPSCGTGMLAAAAGRAEHQRRLAGGRTDPITESPADGAATKPARRAPTQPRAEERAADEPKLHGGSLWRLLLFVGVLVVIPLVTYSIAEGFRETGGARFATRGRGLALPGNASAADIRAFAAWLSEASAFAMWLGPGLAVFATVAGWLGRWSRVLLLVLFVPGLYVMLGGLTLLVALQGALILGVIYLALESGGQIPGFVLILVGLATAYGVYALVSAMLGAVKRTTGHVFGLPLTPEQAPKLWAHVRELAARMKAKPPKQILVGIDPGFWVTQADVESLAGTHKGETMYLSLPLARVLSRAELSAILGHELAHFKGFDTRFSAMFYPVYRGTGQSLAWIDHLTDESFFSWLTLLPAQIVLEYFYKQFMAAEARLSRGRELAADRAGAALADARTAAIALAKVHWFDDHWRDVRGLMRGANSKGQRLENVSLTYVDVLRRAAAPSVLEGLDRERLPHPTDTHPPLYQRLEALGVPLAEVGAAALAVAPNEPAIDLIDDAEAIERKLSEHVPEQAMY